MRKLTSTLHQFEINDTIPLQSLQEEIIHPLVKEMANQFDNAIIEVVRGLNLCKEGEEFTFMNNNHCFQENNEYWLRCKQGLFHLLKMSKPEFLIKSNPIDDNSTIYGTFLIEKIGKKVE